LTIAFTAKDLNGREAASAVRAHLCDLGGEMPLKDAFTADDSGCVLYHGFH
jgi:hypothetical protein